MGTEIGQMYDVNMQCEKAVGQGSYLCLQFYSDFETVCTGMWCKDPASTQCTLILPADGTTCNSSKWCRQGNCVTSVNAPNVPSTCLYGDIKGIVYGSYTCQSMGTQQPWGCYQQNSSCCTTCQSLYTGINGCEYGDKTNCSGVTNSQCYAGDNANLCCETCQSFSTNIPAWVIPVAVVAAVVVIILVLVGVVCYCLRTRKPKAAKPPARGPSTISRGFTGTANVAYQMDSVAVTDRYAYIPPQNVSGPRVSALSKQKPPPARPPPRRPPPPGRQLSTTSQPHEYVEITAPTHSQYMELQARQSTKSRAYQSLKIPNT